MANWRIVFDAVLVLLVLLNGFAFANVEKTVFIAPIRQPIQDASIEYLLLIPLNPQHTTARTWINATFPTREAPSGKDTWMLLEGLSPGTRYEVRVCWLATQPTAFNIFTHAIDEAFKNPTLLSSLTVFSNRRRETLDHLRIQKLQDRKHHPTLPGEAEYSSLLFLQISAAADYFSLNKTLMEHVPPVFVDVILDQYIFNIFPKSLIPTAGYIMVLTVASWLLATYLWRALNRIIRPDVQQVDASKKSR